MSNRWRDLPYRKGANPLHWIRAYPLFAAAGVIFLGIAAILSWKFLTDFVGPGKFVIVEYHAVDRRITTEDVTLSIVRVTFQPAFDIKVGRYLRARDTPKLFIDGRIENASAKPMVAFMRSSDRDNPAILTGRDGRLLEFPVRTVGTGRCPAAGSSASIIQPGKGLRFGIALSAEKGQPGAWVRDAVASGEFPQMSLGDFAFGDCKGADPLSELSGRWRVDFEASGIPEAELGDYYPFGAPTGGPIGLNGRPYWLDWLPRAN